MATGILKVHMWLALFNSSVEEMETSEYLFEASGLDIKKVKLDNMVGIIASKDFF